MNCPKCGAQLSAESKICGECGTLAVQKKGISKIAVIIVAVLALIAVAGTVVWWFFLREEPAPAVDSFIDTENKSLEAVTAELKEMGYEAAVISVYEEKRPDRAVFVTEEFAEAADNGYITVAVNDHSYKTNMDNMILAPVLIPASSYEAVIETAAEGTAKRIGAFYNLVENVYVCDPSISMQERSSLSECFAESGYTSEQMLADYVATGLIPTLDSDITAEVLSQDNCEYSFGCITKYMGTSGNIVIPEEIDGEKITSVDISNVYAYGTNRIYSVTLGAHIEQVNNISMTIHDINSNGAKPLFGNDIGAGCFSTNNDGFVSVDGVLVEYSGEEDKIVIPENVEYIACRAFYRNETVTEVSVPMHVLSVGTEAFVDCSNLSRCSLPKDDCVLGTALFDGCDMLEFVYLPKNIEMVPDNCFRNCSSLKSIEIPDSVTTLGKGAFACSGLTELKLPEGVTVISDECFAGSALTSFDMPEQINQIGYRAFERTNITSITIPEGVTGIFDNTFLNCLSLESVTIPDSTEHIGFTAFSGCSSLITVNGASNVRNVQRGAFEGTPFADSQTEFAMIGDGVLIQYNGNGGNVTLPDKVKYVCYAFEDAFNVTSVHVNDGCIYISGDMNHYITDIYIPSSVTELNLGYMSYTDDETGELYYTVIHCKTGSYAHAYAVERGHKYVTE